MHSVGTRLMFFVIYIAFCSISVRGEEPAATPVSSITIPSGFKVELLRSAGTKEGSWISMTFDNQGRLILGLDDTGIARIHLSKQPENIQFELIEQTLKHNRGILYAHDSLYVSSTNSKGFYRLKDTNGDDKYDELKLLKNLDYRSRYGHGSNQVVLGPNKQIYLVLGNDVSFPEGTSSDSPYRNPQNDHLLPNPHDAGHDDRVGSIIKIDPEGRNWEVIAGGFRNQFDMAFNSDGEMFTFDADMEWDVGQPWYRPTRVNHIVSGGEYGWRWGTGKWPEYFAESLPSTLNTGLGSPTGVVFGTESQFPERYRRALFMADWQNGRILLVDLIPQGASYQAVYQVFLEGGPLNVCDMQFGPDGALYFVTGGRGSQSGLYRVTALKQGEFHPPAPQIKQTQLKQAKSARIVRRQLEKYHTVKDASALNLIWTHLNSADRWLRFAAFRALENQPVVEWRKRALSETRTQAAIYGLIALCHQGEPAEQKMVFNALNKIPIGNLDEQQFLNLLRAFQLCFIRLGKPTNQQVEILNNQLDSFYPHSSSRVNHLLGELFVYLQNESALERTLKFLTSEYTQEEQIRAAMTLTHAKTGWTTKRKRTFLKWHIHARSFRDGKLIGDRMQQIRDDFLKTLSTDDLKLFEEQINALKQPLDEGVTAPARPLVKRWKYEEIEPLLEQVEQQRSYKNGKQALLAASCLKCHRIGSSGTQIGPDLTTVGKRFDVQKILESIIEPSKVMDPKYRFTAYVLNNGKIVTGRPVGVNKKIITVETNPITRQTVEIPRAEIEESTQSKTSPMPTGMIDVLQLEEILDLLAFLKSGGNPQAKAFRSSSVK